MTSDTVGSTAAAHAKANAAPTRTVGAIARDFVAISKPRIIFLLLIVAWAAMFVASGGLPDLGAWLAVTVAGILSTASSGAWNHIIERDRDRRMERTADRPVASGRLSVLAASTYASLAGAIAFAAVYLPGYHLAAWLTLGAIAFYVFFYTVFLKPRTAQNIVLGGFAGSFPALIGWAAVTGDLSVGAWLLAALVFFWTPPHFWALALMYQDDYAAADYPMLPVVKGEAVTKRWMAFYAVVTVAVSLAVGFVAGSGYLYAAAAGILGFLLVARCLALRGEVETATIRSYFFWTIQYLGILLVVLMVDQVLVGAWPDLSVF